MSPALRRRVCTLGLAAQVLGLALGTAALEIGTGIALAAALAAGNRAHRPWLAAAAAVGAVWMMAALAHGPAQWHAGVGRVWPLAPALSVPMLLAALDPTQRRRMAHLGLWAAAAVGLGATLQGLWQGQMPWVQGATGPFDHHLSLGYGLVIPAAVALWLRAWAPAALMASGILAAGGTGPILSLGVAALALWLPPLWCLLGGLAVASGAIVLRAQVWGDAAITERSLLWTTGGLMAQAAPSGVGPAGFRLPAAAIQDGLQTGYHFPLHAHDAGIQMAALAGFGMWAAWSWLGLGLWTHGGRAGQAALAAVLVGGLTQDTLGDLPVLRSLLVWVGFAGALHTAANPGRGPGVPEGGRLGAAAHPMEEP